MSNEEKPIEKLVYKTELNSRNFSMTIQPIPEALKEAKAPQSVLERQDGGNKELLKKGLDTMPMPQELKPTPQPNTGQGNGNSQNAGTGQQGNNNSEAPKK